MIKEMVGAVLLPWQHDPTMDGDIVLDSRVRLARNIKQHLFPARASAEELQAVTAEVSKSLPQLDAACRCGFEYTALENLTRTERELAAAKRFISGAFVDEPENRGLAIREDGAAALMVNGADHLVIRTVGNGFALHKAAYDAFRIDDALEEKLDFAFHEDFGYLTSVPSLTGTGFSAGVTLHLPALAAMNRLRRITQDITKFGFVFGGLYSSRNMYVGNIFQISNQVTLGVTEKDIISRLEEIVTHVVKEERECRTLLLKNEPDTLHDRLMRSYGLLSQAWLVDYEEALSLLSDVQLAAALGYLSLRTHAYAALMSVSEPAYIHAAGGGVLDTEEKVRARILQHTLREYLL